MIQQQQFPPSYSTMFLNLLTTCSSTATDSTVNREGSGVGSQPMGCPYYPLTGPPPSYDSVIQLTSDGGVMTSCLVAAPTSPIITVEAQDVTLNEVNNNDDAGEVGAEIIQEIVISEPRRSHSQQPLEVNPSGITTTALGESRITQAADYEDEEEEVEAAAVDAETPLISVKCNSQSTQLERSNTTNCEGFVAVVVVSATSPAGTSEGS